MVGLGVLVGVVLAATVFGIWHRRTSGRIRDSGSLAAGGPATTGIVPAAAGDPPADIVSAASEAASTTLDAVLDGRLGERATVVQFSSAFCQPCRATRRILEEVTALLPGVAHVEIDAEDSLDLVRTLGIRRTPTVLFLDASGALRKRASGMPRKVDVIAALGELLPGDPVPG